MKRLIVFLAIATVVMATVAAVFLWDSDDAGDSHREIPGDADPENAVVIDDWAMTLAAGDVEGAAGFFAIPSVAENGGIVVEIESRGDARLFNASLPCGAELTRADDDGEFTIATFRLTERPGPGSCGDGVGMPASTAFVIDDGEIVEWRRVDDGGPEAPSTPA